MSTSQRNKSMLRAILGTENREGSLEATNCRGDIGTKGKPHLVEI